MTSTAKLFMCGRSQAIRLPGQLRLDAEEVRIEQVGNALWVQAEPEPGQNMADWLTTFYQTTEPMPAAFLADRLDAPLQSRQWSPTTEENSCAFPVLRWKSGRYPHENPAPR